MTPIEVALEKCRQALEVYDETAIDGPAAELLEALGHPMPVSFAAHRLAFLDALANALYTPGDEAAQRRAFARLTPVSATASSSPCPVGASESAGGPSILPKLREWRDAIQSGNREAALELERALIGALAPPDDGIGEAARAEIENTFASALASDDEDRASRILGDSRERLVRALRHLEAGRDSDARVPVPVPEITGEYPRPVLSLAGLGGALVSEGSVGILSGAGGSAKSALALHLALAFAMAPPQDDDRPTPLHGGIFDARRGGGSVLYLSHENEPPVARDPLVELARQIDRGEAGVAHDALKRVHVMAMMGRPLFGPTDRGAGAGLYNARPGPLLGWGDLVRAVESIRPRLVVVDPVLAAYVGDSNSVAPVREFLGPLACLAGEHGLSVLLIAHSNKAVRKGKAADLLDPGQVGGSGHWFDTVRGVLVLNRLEDEGRVLACAKANRGPDRLVLPLNTLSGSQGRPLALSAADVRGWRKPPPTGDRGSGRANGRDRDAQSVHEFAPGVA